MLAFGTLIKTQLIAMAPAVVLALVLLSGIPQRTRIRWRPLAVGTAVAAVPLITYYVLGQTVWDRPVIDRVSDVVGARDPQNQRTLAGLASYVWQAYLPRLPFLDDWFGGYALKSLWVDGLLGRFGWLDYRFPAWVLTLGSSALALIGVGAVVALVRARDAVRRRASGGVFVTCSMQWGSPLPWRWRATCTALETTGSSSSRRGTCSRSCRSTRLRWRSPHGRWAGATCTWGAP